MEISKFIFFIIYLLRHLISTYTEYIYRKQILVFFSRKKKEIFEDVLNVAINPATRNFSQSIQESHIHDLSE